MRVSTRPFRMQLRFRRLQVRRRLSVLARQLVPRHFQLDKRSFRRFEPGGRFLTVNDKFVLQARLVRRRGGPVGKIKRSAGDAADHDDHGYQQFRPEANHTGTR